MAEQTEISLKPIGIVSSSYTRADRFADVAQTAEIEIFAPYSPALLRIEENSHLWILLWFHQSDRKLLTTVPRHFDATLPEFGVFSLRSPNRPNPIGLTLVSLLAVEGNILKVKGLDAIDRTPVLDIKPYFEQDIIFSPRTPYIRRADYQMRRELFLKEVLAHHQEECAGAYMAVRMALIADARLGHLNVPDINLLVCGSPCLADGLQAVSRARLANPPRFRFQEDLNQERSIWEKGGLRLVITARQGLDAAAFTSMSDEELFTVEIVEP